MGLIKFWSFIVVNIAEVIALLYLSLSSCIMQKQHIKTKAHKIKEYNAVYIPVIASICYNNYTLGRKHVQVLFSG